jgi:VIT1/CCC1 family predicted Fe2+/Mn2+ transporter
MVQKLGLRVPDDDDNPLVDGAVTFASFLMFGGLPLFPYIAWHLLDFGASDWQLSVCLGMTAVTLFALGALQAWVTRGSWWAQGGLMTINGGLAAGASYLVGWGMQSLVGAGSLCPT